MKLVKYASLVLLFLSAGISYGQDDSTSEERKPGHTNNNRFKQLYEEFDVLKLSHSYGGKSKILQIIKFSKKLFLF